MMFTTAGSMLINGEYKPPVVRVMTNFPIFCRCIIDDGVIEVPPGKSLSLITCASSFFSDPFPNRAVLLSFSIAEYLVAISFFVATRQRRSSRLRSLVEPFGLQPFLRWSIGFKLVNVLSPSWRLTVLEPRCSLERSVPAEVSESVSQSILSASSLILWASLLLIMLREIQGHTSRWQFTIFCTSLWGVFPLLSLRISMIDCMILSKTTLRAIFTAFFSLLRVAFDLSFLLDGGLDIFCLSGSFRFDNCTTLRLVVITDTIINLRELTKWIEKWKYILSLCNNLNCYIPYVKTVLRVKIIK